MTTVLLLGAGGSAAANVLDALRRAARPGLRVVGADAAPRRLHLSAADERVAVPRADDAGYADALVGLVERFGVAVVLPQPDPDVLAVGHHRDRLAAAGAATFLPPQATLELAADKAAAAAAMGDAGVAVPLSVACTSVDDVAACADKVLAARGAAWIRARRGAGSRAALPVRTPEQADAWVRWWVDEKGLDGRDFMVCELLPGREYAYQSVWCDGVLIAGQARERVEYLYGHLTPSGQTSTPAAARTVAEPGVDAVAQAAVRALDPAPHGTFCVDVKEDADGCPCVTEVNAGRFFTTSNFFAAAGLNMPDLAVRIALGERPPAVGSSPLPADLWWLRMVDMGSVLVSGNQLGAFEAAP